MILSPALIDFHLKRAFHDIGEFKVLPFLFSSWEHLDLGDMTVWHGVRFFDCFTKVISMNKSESSCFPPQQLRILKPSVGNEAWYDRTRVPSLLWYDS